MFDFVQSHERAETHREAGDTAQGAGNGASEDNRTPPASGAFAPVDNVLDSLMQDDRLRAA